MKTTILAIFAVLTACGGMPPEAVGSSPRSENPATSQTVIDTDAGTPEVDAGTPAVDAGTPVTVTYSLDCEGVLYDQTTKYHLETHSDGVIIDSCGTLASDGGVLTWTDNVWPADTSDLGSQDGLCYVHADTYGVDPLASVDGGTLRVQHVWGEDSASGLYETSTRDRSDWMGVSFNCTNTTPEL